MRHGTCFRRRLSTHHAGAAPHSAVAELGVVRRRYALCVQRTFSPSLFLLHAIIRLSRLSSTQRESVPGTSSPFAPRSPFVSRLSTHRSSPGVARRFCAQATARGGSFPFPSRRFGRQFAELSTQVATPNHALQRTAPCVTLAAPADLPQQPARRTPLSLSLRSLGVARRLPNSSWPQASDLAASIHADSFTFWPLPLLLLRGRPTRTTTRPYRARRLEGEVLARTDFLAVERRVFPRRTQHDLPID